MRGDRGAALLLSILAIGVLGAGLMAVLGLSVDERRSLSDDRAFERAYVVAEAGLSRYVADRAAVGLGGSPAGAYESTRVAVSGGYADVVARRVRAGTSNSAPVYAVSARGYTIAADGAVRGERLIQQLATWRASGATIRPLAAWTSFSGVQKSSAGGIITGVDACAAQSPIAGIATRTPPGYEQSNGRSVPAGNPAVRGFTSVATLADSVGLDWAGIVAGTAVQPDVALPGGSWPAGGTDEWPVILVNGNYTMTAGGQGTLIVTGRLTISAAVSWRGLILVGADVDANAKLDVSGAVISGLNAALGQAPIASDLRSGNHEIMYHSCDAAAAAQRLGESGMVLLSGTWMERRDY